MRITGSMLKQSKVNYNPITIVAPNLYLDTNTMHRTAYTTIIISNEIKSEQSDRVISDDYVLFCSSAFSNGACPARKKSVSVLTMFGLRF